MADYRGYVTAAGQQFEALAKQMHYPVKIGFIEIGDGTLPDNESPISRTSLVHKTKQFPAIVEQDPERPGEWIAKCHIPSDDAINGQGYFIREMGCKLVDQGDGVLYAYRRISNDWKPLITEGEAKSFIYILRFIPSNGELIKPTINPSVVYVDKLEQERRFRQHGDEDDPHTQYQTVDEATKLILDIIDIAIPVGIPFAWPRAELPPSKYGITFLKWNGAAFSAEQYPKLAKVLPHLRLSDLRADYIIGWDDGRGVDVGRQLLSHRDGSFPAHHHGIDTSEAWDPDVWNSFGIGNDHGGDSIIATDNISTLNGPNDGILGLRRQGYFRTTVSGFGTKVHTDSTAFLMIVRAS